jgi:hypothetical protein
MNAYLNEWGGDKNKIKITTSDDDSKMDDDVSYFNVCDRTYTKKQTAEEIRFMKFLLPHRGKFIPTQAKI